MSALQVRVSDLAEQELYRIAWFIAQDSPTHAQRFLQNMYTKFQSIGRSPRIYQLRPELGRDIRIAVLGRHLIMYRIIEDAVLIDHIMDGARDLSSVLESDDEP